MKHILGVLGSEAFNLDLLKTDYTVKIEIEEEVYNWLENHDVIWTVLHGNQTKVYVCNDLKYAYLGPKIEFKTEENVIEE
jgi:hypothetical protein